MSAVKPSDLRGVESVALVGQLLTAEARLERLAGTPELMFTRAAEQRRRDQVAAELQHRARLRDEARRRRREANQR